MYQNCHWQCSGLSFYQHHLLFQRLYEGVLGDIDVAAEKIIGVFDSKIIELDSQIKIMKMLGEKFAIDSSAPITCFKTAIDAEKGFQKIAAALRKELESNNDLTLGVDDMLAAQSSSSEERLYLLKSSLPE
jgi:DNA-binding ferritin-like protein